MELVSLKLILLFLFLEICRVLFREELDSHGRPPTNHKDEVRDTQVNFPPNCQKGAKVAEERGEESGGTAAKRRYSVLC